MKSFFKQVFATVVGIIVFGLIMAVIGIFSIIGMAFSSDQVKSVPNNSVLVMDLSGVIQEQSDADILGQLTGNTYRNMGLNDILSAVKKAKDNKRVKGIYIEAGPLETDWATLQEIRNALLDFKKSGKWIVAYGETITQGAYYVASVADKVWLNPQGMLDWHGIGAEPVFVKDLLAKVGIRMQILKVGKYKSATEMFSEDKMSDANREQTQAYINSLWGNVCKGVSESRGISVAQLNQYADSCTAFTDQQQLVKMKLVDGLIYTDQVKQEVKKLLKIDAKKDINQMSIADMAAQEDSDKGGEVAVYYAYGDIVDTPATGTLLGGSHNIVGKDVCKDLEELADDDDVKAVVIRINSGGGSAYASEQMWHQIEMLKAKKPVVVSMGGMAASGGYYMSSGANYIVAQPTTLTGSIGIFGMIPDRSELLTKKLGIKFDAVQTNKHTLFGTSSRPMNADELSIMQAYITRGYQLFRKRVSDGRKLSVAQVEENAQGHVFTGEDALKIKLVDALGGLNMAVEKAAKLAKLDAYHTETYPAAPSFLDQLMGSVESDNYLDEQLRAVLGSYYEPFMLLKSATEQDPIQARVPFYMNLK